MKVLSQITEVFNCVPLRQGNNDSINIEYNIKSPLVTGTAMKGFSVSVKWR